MTIVRVKDLDPEKVRAMPVVLSLAVAIPLLAFWALMARDLTHNEYLRDDERRFWTIVLVFFNVLGASAYYWYVYQNRNRN